MTRLVSLSPDSYDGDYPHSRRPSAGLSISTAISSCDGSSPSLFQVSVGSASVPRTRTVSVDDTRISDKVIARLKTAAEGKDSPGHIFFPRQPFHGADKHWWVPRFTLQEFEDVYQRNEFPHRRRRFRCATAISSVICLVWLVYLAVCRSLGASLLIGPIIFLAIYLGLCTVSFSRYFSMKWEKPMIYLLTVLVVTSGLGIHAYAERDVSLVLRFSMAIISLILIYSVLPLPFHYSVLVALSYSVAHEALEKILARPTSPVYSLTTLILCKVLLHLSIHLFMLYSGYVAEVISRNTFWQLGHSLIYQHDLSFELDLTAKMLNSVMPQKFSGNLLASSSRDDMTVHKLSREDIHATGSSKYEFTTKTNKDQMASTNKTMSLGFRQLNLHKQDGVSILFADIVGFTRMSSNKSACDLVALLNNLFGRFDALALTTGCEKISTLGDCYYCVAGCPDPCRDAADRCVRMGLAMLLAIQEFCHETCEAVDMRVGIHTGSVLCGTLGTTRIKFDVFSNDVRLANQMESSGVAGKVHISQATYDALLEKSGFTIVDGDAASRNPAMKGITTYLLGNPVTELPASRRLDLAAVSRDKLYKDSESDTITQRINLDDLTSINRVVDGQGSFPRNSVPTTRSESFSWDSLARDDSLIKLKQWKRFSLPPPPLTGQPLPEDEQLSDARSLPMPMSPPPLSPTPTSPGGCSRGRASRGLSDASSLFLPTERHITVPASPDIHRSSIVAEMVARLPVAVSPRTTHPANLDPNTLHSAILDGARIQMNRMVNIFEGRDSWLDNKDLEDDGGYHPLTLSFRDPVLEARFKSQFSKDSGMEAWSTFDSPRFTVLLRALLCFIFFLVSSTVVFILFSNASIEYPIVFAVSLTLLLAIVIASAAAAYPSLVPSRLHSLLKVVMGWQFLNTLFLILFFAPALSSFVNVFGHCERSNFETFDGTLFLFFLAQAALTQILIFTHACAIFKYLATALVGGCAVAMAAVGCSGQWHACVSTDEPLERFGSVVTMNGTTCQHLFSYNVTYEIIINVVLLACILNFLNREFEIASRLSFRTNIFAQVKFCEIEDQKYQADLLLSNIVPDHVVEKLQTAKTYSENHDLAAVVFVCITNFDDFYSESFEGGLECLRVLNELISDFDELLQFRDFSSVNKIKTIGATYMAASGLSLKSCGDRTPTRHLAALLDFALRLQDLVTEFNENMIGFNFKLRIGYNCGPVTSGVVGTTKLLYDIWGDTVNVASRMESTGVEGRIQMPEKCLKWLESGFECTPREEPVAVKGKGEMKTVFVDGRKCSPQYNIILSDIGEADIPLRCEE